jgi:hypothetical protein
MADEQKEAVMRKKKEAETSLALLEAEARSLAWTFPGELGASLRASPEYVVFECQLSSVDVRYYTPVGRNRVYKSDEASERIIALTSEIRSTLLRIADLSEQLSQLEALSAHRCR